MLNFCGNEDSHLRNGCKVLVPTIRSLKASLVRSRWALHLLNKEKLARGLLKGVASYVVARGTLDMVPEHTSASTSIVVTWQTTNAATRRDFLV